MLVDKKFIFISLPRCASTSFMITCLKNKIPIEHRVSDNDNQLSKINDWDKLSNDELADKLTHSHESLSNLQKKFGNKYEVISIRRNKYERFLSLWKHVIDELYRIQYVELAQGFSKLTVNDIFDGIHPNDITTVENRYRTIDTVFKKINSLNMDIKLNPYVQNMLSIVYMPITELTNENPNIIWFDITELDKLEKWVSNKLVKEFKLEKINSSQNFDCNIEINDEFKKKYDNLFNIFENRKSTKTLI